MNHNIDIKIQSKERLGFVVFFSLFKSGWPCNLPPKHACSMLEMQNFTSINEGVDVHTQGRFCQNQNFLGALITRFSYPWCPTNNYLLLLISFSPSSHFFQQRPYNNRSFFILQSGEGLAPSIKIIVPTYRVRKKWCNEAFHGVYLLRISPKISSSKSSLSLNVKGSNAQH